MNEEKPEEQLSFDEMELHSDVHVGRQEKPPAQRREKTTSSKGSPLLAILFGLLALGAGAGAWYFYDLHKGLEMRYSALIKEQDSTRLNLSETAGTLDEANAQIVTFKKMLGAQEKKNEDLTNQNKVLNADIASRDKEIKNLKSRNDKSAKDLKNTRASLNRATSERNQARKELADLKTSSSEQIAALETTAQEMETAHTEARSSWDTNRRRLEKESGDAKAEVKRLQDQFEEESQASLAIIREKNQLQQERTQLQQDIRKKNSELASARKRIKALENVDVGELVPYSEEITGGQVSYREPLPDGAKVPRKIGQVALQVLVTEVGSVEKAFIIPGQELEADLSRALIQSVYKWKFSPPTYRQTRVKTWLTVLVKSE